MIVRESEQGDGQQRQRGRCRNDVAGPVVGDGHS